MPPTNQQADTTKTFNTMSYSVSGVMSRWWAHAQIMTQKPVHIVASRSVVPWFT